MPDLEALRSQLAENPDGVIEQIAKAYGVTTHTATKALPAKHRTCVPGTYLADLLEDLIGWGEVMLIINLGSLIAEIKTAIPAATPGRGYLNFHGEAPFGGHLKEDACSEIIFIDRPFFGRRSLSVQFFEDTGNCLFKVFVRRDEDKELVAEQAAKFDALRLRYSKAATQARA